MDSESRSEACSYFLAILIATRNIVQAAKGIRHVNGTTAGKSESEGAGFVTSQNPRTPQSNLLSLEGTDGSQGFA